MGTAARLTTLAILACTAAFVSAQTPKLDQEKAKVAKLEQAYKSAKAAYTKKQGDTKLKQAYADATVKYATAVMTTPTMTSKDKYPAALRLYREALVVDPHNKEAYENKMMIISIYKSLGRPIPK